WSTPCSLIEAESSWRASASKTIRGWPGFDSMRSIDRTLTPVVRPAFSDDSRETMAGESSRSSDSRRAATARKSGLAKVDYLPGELAIGARGFGCTGVRRDRPTGQGRLTQLHGVADDAAEDVVIADDAQLVQHVPGEIRPAVVEGRQEPQDPEVAVQLHPDHVDDLDEIVQTLHRVVLGLDRDDDAVCGD